MTVLTPGQAYTLLRQAGFTPALAAIMTAIGGAESGLRTDARGDLGLQTAVWGPSIGPWQERSLKAETGTGSPRDASRLTDPAFAARAAFSTWQSQGLHAWSTYTSGAYRSFLGGANAAAAAGGSPLTGAAAAPARSPAAAGNAQSVDWVPGGNLNSLNWPGNLGDYFAGKAKDTVSSSSIAVWTLVQPFLITGGFLVLGGSLILAGAITTARPKN